MPDYAHTGATISKQSENCRCTTSKTAYIKLLLEV